MILEFLTGCKSGAAPDNLFYFIVFYCILLFYDVSLTAKTI